MPFSNVKPAEYSNILAAKVADRRRLFEEFKPPPVEVFSSSPSGFRMRAEFRLWHQHDDLFYAMFKPEEPKQPCRIDYFPIGSPRIQQLMPQLLEHLKTDSLLREKVFQVEFLTTLAGQALITLIYHRKLDEQWTLAAQTLANTLGCSIIGRSRKQKVILANDYVEERLQIDGRDYYYRQYEQAFTQPNAEINSKMISWATNCYCSKERDLLELYCGNGNFTVALGNAYRKILATEISKTSVKAAQYNIERNSCDNIQIVRMSAEDISKAINKERKFRRLENIPLQDYNFSTVFVDPPRSGLDDFTLHMVTGFENILYISCNPYSLRDNLSYIYQSHEIRNFAFFDQFPYTDHIECGIFLSRR